MSTRSSHARNCRFIKKLFNEKKGKTGYKGGEAFLLHVFWEAPSETAAHRLLDALQHCAEATRRDTPCVPTYFFRISTSDAVLYGDAPKIVKDHAQLAAAIKKLKVGIPRGAVASDLVRRGIDPCYLDLDLDAELPAPLQGQKPVAVEFTELYLDERAFMEHTGSREYMEAYGTVMSPGLCNRQPTTLRFGSAPQALIEKILDPILKEIVVPLGSNSSVWNRPERRTDTQFILSADFPSAALEAHDFSTALQAACCCWSIQFVHPLRQGVSRLVAVFPSLDGSVAGAFDELATLKPFRGELHIHNDFAKQLERMLAGSGLPSFTVNAARSVGYCLHEKAPVLRAE